LALFFVPRIFKKHQADLDTHNEQVVSLAPIYKYFLPVSLAMISFTILTNIDVILVKHFFSPLKAGYYSIAQMVGKIFLFLPSALAVVIFPKSTEAYINQTHSQRILYKSLLMASIFCGIGIILCFSFPDFILKILTSKPNQVSSNLVGLFSLTMSFYACLWIVINFSLATHNLKFVLPISCIAILEAITIYFYHPTLKSILGIMLFFSLGSLILLSLLLKNWRN